MIIGAVVIDWFNPKKILAICAFVGKKFIFFHLLVCNFLGRRWSIYLHSKHTKDLFRNDTINWFMNLAYLQWGEKGESVELIENVKNDDNNECFVCVKLEFFFSSEEQYQSDHSFANDQIKISFNWCL